MPNLTLAIPEDLKSIMDLHPEMNWSEVARQAFREKASQLEILNTIASKSKFTEKDALMIGRKIKKSMWSKNNKELI